MEASVLLLANSHKVTNSYNSKNVARTVKIEYGTKFR
jgi:hypothetical protein